MNRIWRCAMTVLVSGGLGLAGLGLGAGIGHADGARQWCPGDDLRRMLHLRRRCAGPCLSRGRARSIRRPARSLDRVRTRRCMVQRFDNFLRAMTVKANRVTSLCATPFSPGKRWRAYI